MFHKNLKHSEKEKEQPSSQLVPFRIRKSRNISFHLQQERNYGKQTTFILYCQFDRFCFL